ncbi:hypothetical protein [Consotaella aegiceratis]|uniref:hypothetical protein n=1 Tax=Consotaella aegiceratis TaxID=3097961 RepID=UPI002F3E264F
MDDIYRFPDGFGCDPTSVGVMRDAAGQSHSMTRLAEFSVSPSSMAELPSAQVHLGRRGFHLDPDRATGADAASEPEMPSVLLPLAVAAGFLMMTMGVFGQIF